MRLYTQSNALVDTDLFALSIHDVGNCLPRVPHRKKCRIRKNPTRLCDMLPSHGSADVVAHAPFEKVRAAADGGRLHEQELWRVR